MTEKEERIKEEGEKDQVKPKQETEETKETEEEINKARADKEEEEEEGEEVYHDAIGAERRDEESIQDKEDVQTKPRTAKLETNKIEKRTRKDKDEKIESKADERISKTGDEKKTGEEVYYEAIEEEGKAEENLEEEKTEENTETRTEK